MRVLIVDNDSQIRAGLAELLKRFCPVVKTIAEAESVTSGLRAISEFQPDLVYLDVEMDDGTGFDLIQQLGNVSFQLVFITAFNKYAVQAFRFSALDFLQKPIDPEELIRSVERARQGMDNANLREQLKVMQEALQSKHPATAKIVLKDNEAIHFVKVEDIIRCEADGAYTRFVIQGSNSILLSKSLKEYEDLLTEHGFIRCHHSHLVNSARIVRFDKADGGMLVLENKETVPVSHRKKDSVLELLARL